MSEWIVVRNWERFQHYGKRDPPWIKIYTELLNDPNFGHLTHAQRSTLLGLWLMYAKSRRQIPVDTAWITRQLNVKVTRATLEALNHAGFIDFVASKPLATRAQATETETEKERTTYVRPLDQWSYPQVGNEELFELDEKVKGALKDFP